MHNITRRSVCNRNQSLQALHRHPVFSTDSDHDHIIDDIVSKDKIKYERNIYVGDD